MEKETSADHMGVKSFWRIIPHTEFDAHVHGCSELSFVSVCSCGTLVRVWVDDSALLEDVRALNFLAAEDAVADAELFFIARQETRIVDVDDAEKVRVFCRGGRHYGRLKSLISSIGSYCRETAYRHGFHASVFKTLGRGVVIAAPPGLGKSLVLATHRHLIDSVVTDDWCDIVVRDGYACAAEQVDSGMSFNERDFRDVENGCCARLCECGWRRKYFMPLKSFGIPVVKHMDVCKLVLITTGSECEHDFDASGLMRCTMSTSPHTLFGTDFRMASAGHRGKSRLAFFENLLRVVHAGRLEVVVLHAVDAKEAVARVGRLIESWSHGDVLRELLSKKSEILSGNCCSHGVHVRFSFPHACLSPICRENQSVALNVFNALKESLIPMRCFFVHGSTGRGYGQMAPNISWDFPEKSGMRTWVTSNCRDDVDIVCVCGDEWKSYAECIRRILRSVVPPRVEVTLNLVGERELMEELMHPDSPAMRRVVLFNAPWVVSGEDCFSRLYETALANCTEFDRAHEVDFKTLMNLSGILESHGMHEFIFSDGELQSVLPTFWRMKHEHVHVGFPQRREKLKNECCPS